jgi:hypothetical protein
VPPFAPGAIATDMRRFVVVHTASWRSNEMQLATTANALPLYGVWQMYSDMAFAPGKRGGGVRNQLAITSQVFTML